MIIITAAVDVADIIETAAASLAKFKVPLAMNVFMHNTGKRKVWYGLTRLRPCDSSLFFSHHSTVSFPFLFPFLSYPIPFYSILFSLSLSAGHRVCAPLHTPLMTINRVAERAYRKVGQERTSHEIWRDCRRTFRTCRQAVRSEGAEMRLIERQRERGKKRKEKRGKTEIYTLLL